MTHHFILEQRTTIEGEYVCIPGIQLFRERLRLTNRVYPILGFYEMNFPVYIIVMGTMYVNLEPSHRSFPSVGLHVYFELADRFVLHVRRNVTVGVQRDLDAGVPEPFLNDLGVNPSFEQ